MTRSQTNLIALQDLFYMLARRHSGHFSLKMLFFKVLTNVLTTTLKLYLVSLILNIKVNAKCKLLY